MSAIDATQRSLEKPAPAAGEQRVLFLGPAGGLSDRIAEAFETMDVNLTCADTAVKGLAAVGGGAPDVVMLDAAAGPDLKALPATLRKRTGFANVPLMILAESADLLTPADRNVADDIMLGNFGADLLKNK